MSHHESHVRTAEKEANLARQAMETDGGALHGATGTATHEAVARRAYDIYIKSGSKAGHCKDNWAKAETDLNDESQARRTPKESEKSPAHPAAVATMAAVKPLGTTPPGHLSNSVRSASVLPPAANRPNR